MAFTPTRRYLTVFLLQLTWHNPGITKIGSGRQWSNCINRENYSLKYIFLAIYILINRYHICYLWSPISFSPKPLPNIQVCHHSSFGKWCLVTECWRTSNGHQEQIYRAVSCFTYLSTYPLGIYLSDRTECLWVSVTNTEHAWVHVNAFWVSGECDWIQMNTTEHVWMQSECAWTFLSEHWMRLNVLECMWMPLSEFDLDWIHCFTGSHMKLSVDERLWVSVNMIERAWMHSECGWMCLSKYWTWLNVLECMWVCVNTFEQVLNPNECAWMCLNALECMWTPLSEYWTYVNVHL